ncbi:Na(+)-translocating NADH-quinone reductase subunit A [Gammaproteobacteria bacterium]|mgnify:FL=1|nr:Na(+)-translocating NADH-quinone reductase subunit A [Gammaproteobacteria bacterium]
MILIKKGLNLPISGHPDPVVSDTPTIHKAAILSNDFIGMKPTMLVKEGEKVKLGQKIIEDKKNPGVFFTSPCGGEVSSINRGDKRKFLSIEFDIDAEEESVLFDTNQDPKTLLIESGLFNAFRTRPFNRTPKVEDKPDRVFINACDTNPLAVSPKDIIQLNEADFNSGVAFISSLFDFDIDLAFEDDHRDYTFQNVNSTQFKGPHPAGLASTHINAIYPVNLHRKVWTINYQEVISIGYLVNNGKLRTHKNISLAGESVFNPSIVSARIGSNIDQLCAGKVNSNARVISGSVLFGHDAIDAMSYLGFYDNQVTALPNHTDDVFLNWVMPGKNIHSKLNVFLSAFKKPAKFNFNTGINGGNRAIVPVGSYEEIIPHDILMTQLLKALVVGDVEVAAELGMFELTAEDLALATYVCPSKYDYCSILMDNLNKVYEEL